ncbi:MAG TPA: zinc carboxypeptidase, partial [Bacteroidetes bacterium]|nr:zinc carboxypeptidase [Bacteroidota bacterium]
MPRLLQKFLFTGALVLAFVWPARAQVSLDYYLPAGTSYDSRVPSPQQFFGFQVGEWHLRHDQLAAYMRELARSSDRVTLVEYARTYEQRPLLLLTITSPKNHKNIDNIRARHLALTDPAAEEIEQFDGMPVVVWLGYSVHGNEPSGSNASSLVAYYLAAAQGEEVEAMLENAVILLDPSINPDGLGRFAQWANMHKSKRPVADPNIREHREDWPMGRTNHYWFDLNRDWLPLQHPESRGRIEQFQRWLPNVLTDHHEMGTNATYF